MLPSLLRKAIGDAGFDLFLGPEAEWERVGVSGLAGTIWVVAAKGGGLVAVADRRILSEFARSDSPQVPLPSFAAGAVRCRTAAELYSTLRRVRMLLAQLPPAPQERFSARVATIGTTEVTAIVKQRIGQGLFREMLLDYWDGRCAVTGLALPEVLRASHAKPWAVSNDAERLDVYNGLLLAAHLDALFDHGLMTFDEHGLAVFSKRLNMEALDLLGCSSIDIRLTRVAQAHTPYLAYHRLKVFQDATSG